MLLAAGQGAVAEFGDLAAMPDGGQHIMQHSPGAMMHLDVTTGGQG